MGLLDKKDFMMIRALVDSAVPVKKPGDIDKSGIFKVFVL